MPELSVEELGEIFAETQVRKTHPSFGPLKLGYVVAHTAQQAEIEKLKASLIHLNEQNFEVVKMMKAMEQDLNKAALLLKSAKAALGLYAAIARGFSWRRLLDSIRGVDYSTTARQVYALLNVVDIE